MIGWERGRAGMGVMFISEHFEINKPPISFSILNFFVYVTVVILSQILKKSGQEIGVY